MKLFSILLCGLMMSACGTRSDIKGANLQEAARINTRMGIDYYRGGELDMAITKLKRAVAQDPDLVVARSSLALVYAKQGEYKLADKEYRKAVALDSANGDVRNNFGVFLCDQGKIGEAEQFFVSAAQTKRYATPEAAWTNAGVCLKKTNPEKAERYFRTALEVKPEFPDALANMAWIASQKDEYLKARAFLQRYDLVAAPTPETLSIGARIERMLGDDAAANRYEKRLRTEFPQSEEALSLSKP